MTANMGGFDRAVRVVLGLGILAAGVYFKSWWGLVGVIPLLTAAMRSCPLYRPFGFSTRAGGKAAR